MPTEARLKNLSEYNIPNAGLSDDEIKQILDDYEKARKFEQIKEKVDKIGSVPFVWSDIQKLLEESKK